MKNYIDYIEKYTKLNLIKIVRPTIKKILSKILILFEIINDVWHKFKTVLEYIQISSWCIW